ncbi:MAG TPA: ABC transporter permease subunit [Tepidisphaeraceae bacterium]|nr:ABC transporter permease subunit [Tepidisphaeraceae bacterium]
MRRGKGGWPGRILPPIVVLIAAVALLEAWLRIAHVKSYMAPLPSAVFGAMFHDAPELLAALFWTTLAAASGFIASGVLGVLLAVGLCAWPLARRALYPYTVFFQTVPIVAIAPMLLFWLGFGLLPVGVCALIVSIFPVIANTLAGLLATDPALDDLFRLYGAGPLATMWKLRLPTALPNIFTGLRIAGGLAVIGTVVAEFLVGQIVGHVGLGVLIVAGIHQSRLDIAFAAVLLASLLGLAMFAAVNLAARLALHAALTPGREDGHE